MILKARKKMTPKILAQKTSKGSFSLAIPLTIVFTFLKIFNVISWSWLWVLSPLWISFALTAAIISIILIVLFGFLIIGLGFIFFVN